jgi:energy-coupling factor transport system ATP-binding protein
MDMVIQAKNLYYQYPTSDEPVLKGLYLDIHAGEELILLGKGQSGKSTLAKILAGLLKPSEGEIKVYPPEGVYPKAALVFQNPENQLIGHTVEEDIAFGPGNLGLSPDEIAKRVDEAINICDLKELRHRDILTLSGGEKQRVAIAGAIALRPVCIILDEATAMLDPPARMDFRKALERIKDRYQTSVLKITNSAWEALEAEKVAVLNQGIIAASGPPNEVLWDPRRLEEWGLVMPPFLKLARRLTEAGYPQCQKAKTPEELANIYVDCVGKR